MWKQWTEIIEQQKKKLQRLAIEEKRNTGFKNVMKRDTREILKENKQEKLIASKKKIKNLVLWIFNRENRYNMRLSN